MTLILTAISDSTIWQVSDRRLTKPGQPPDDSAVKTILVLCSDSAFVMGYTGIALTQGSWGERLDTWAAKTISDFPLVDLNGYLVLERFRDSTSVLLKGIRQVAREYKRLTWAIAGFGPRGPFLARITNCEDQRGESLREVADELQLFIAFRNEKPMDKLAYLIVGATPALKGDLLASLHKARKRFFRSHPKRCLNALVQIVRGAACEPRFGRFISKDCLGTILDRTGDAYSWDYRESGGIIHVVPHHVGPACSSFGVTVQTPTPQEVRVSGFFKLGLPPPPGTHGSKVDPPVRSHPPHASSDADEQSADEELEDTA